jgi:glycerophosphoryl diester phosphodiesterase
VTSVPDDWRATLLRLGCVALHCNWKCLTGELAAEIHGAGCGILLWTVNEPSDARRLLAMGADCLVTDALDRVGPAFR